MEDKDKPASIPYLPFKTFINTLDKLKEHNVPTKLDSTFLNTFLNGTNTRLLVATLTFFGLIDSERVPSQALENLALADTEGRKTQLADLLKRHYPEIFKHDLTRATSGVVDGELEKFGVSGDTKRKAYAFFVAAAQYAGIPLSKTITARKTVFSNRKKLKAQGQTPLNDGGNTAQPITESSKPAPPTSGLGGDSHTVKLRSGGEVTLIVSVNLFRLQAEDRDYVLELIDKLREYDEPTEEDDDTDESGDE